MSDFDKRNDVNVVEFSAGSPPPYSNTQPGPPPGPYHGPTVVTHAPIVGAAVIPMIVTTQQMGTKPTIVTCKSCHAEILTKVEPKSTTKTHLFAGLLCLFGCWCCVCIPYCTNSCRNIDHYCPNCNAYIGGYIS